MPHIHIYGATCKVRIGGRLSCDPGESLCTLDIHSQPVAAYCLNGELDIYRGRIRCLQKRNAK
jgi:hypothetical protein